MDKRGLKIGVALALALATTACNDDKAPAPLPTPTPTPSSPTAVTPAGRLSQASPKGEVTYLTESGWRIAINEGAIAVRPPEGAPADCRYSSRGTRELLGSEDLRAWAGDRRSILLPGGAKVTMHGQEGQILRVSLYDGEESHEVDVLTQTLMHSRVDAATAAARDKAEHDGEAGMLTAEPIDHANAACLYLRNVYEEYVGADGLTEERAVIEPLALQFADRVLVYDPPPTGEVQGPCGAVANPQKGLTVQPGGQLVYLTRSERWCVRIDQHTVAVRYMLPAEQAVGNRGFLWEVWGDPHENLNGKHIKDWETDRRSLVLGDGTKITMHANGPQGVVHTTSIYDGEISLEIGNIGNILRHSSSDVAAAKARDASEADGETASLSILRTAATPIGSMIVENIYNEIETQAGMQRELSATRLGVAGDLDTQPNTVHDYYDDPRLGHT